MTGSAKVIAFPEAMTRHWAVFEAGLLRMRGEGFFSDEAIEAACARAKPVYLAYAQPAADEPFSTDVNGWLNKYLNRIRNGLLFATMGAVIKLWQCRGGHAIGDPAGLETEPVVALALAAWLRTADVIRGALARQGAPQGMSEYVVEQLRPIYLRYCGHRSHVLPPELLLGGINAEVAEIVGGLLFELVIREAELVDLEKTSPPGNTDHLRVVH